MHLTWGWEYDGRYEMCPSRLAVFHLIIQPPAIDLFLYYLHMKESERTMGKSAFAFLLGDTCAKY